MTVRDLILYRIMEVADAVCRAACACGFFAVCLLLWVGTP